MDTYKEEIIEKIKLYDDWIDEMLSSLQDAKNLTSQRIINAGQELEKLETQVNELKSLINYED